MENQLSEEHIGRLVGITFIQIMEKLQPETQKYLTIYVPSVLISLFLTNTSKTFYHGTGEDQ